MRFRLPPTAAFLIVLTLFSFFALAGAAQVPFHPDESTQLFTSSDVERFWQRPSSVFWQPEQEANILQRYRELDAPFTRNIIALGRMIAGQPALPRDWDWSSSWNENQQQGALPSTGQLLAGRLAVTALLPFSILFLYLATRRISNEPTAWIAALLMASNALVLLHGRRAMAEGGLLFATTLFLWSLTKAEKRPWLTGIPAALAFSAKQSLAPLVLVSFLAALWNGGASIQRRSVAEGGRAARRLLIHLLAWGGLLFVVLAALHPFTWQRPVPAIQAALRARQSLASEQIADRPEQRLDTPLKKLLGMAGSLYFTPPLFAETANYSAETRVAEEAYLANPLHSLLRSLPGGALLLALNLFGFIIACRTTLHADKVLRRRLLLLLGAAALQTAALFALVPLPWQRYYMPAVPFACMWTAYGLTQLIRPVFARSGSSDPLHPAAHPQEK